MDRLPTSRPATGLRAASGPLRRQGVSVALLTLLFVCLLGASAHAALQGFMNNVTSSTISHSGSIIDIGTETGLIEKRGSFFTYGETRIGQGRENAKQFLEEHPEMMEELEASIRGDKKAAEILTVGAAE